LISVNIDALVAGHEVVRNLFFAIVEELRLGDAVRQEEKWNKGKAAGW
jgi:hypothetical protein